MINEILPNLYKIEVPLPRSPLKATNSYIIRDGVRCLIIDTGWNHETSKSTLSAGLKELRVDLDKADFFVTHMHADHLGLVSTLATKTSTIYSSRAGVENVKAHSDWNSNDFAFANGFPEDERSQAAEAHPGVRYGGQWNIDFHTLVEGDRLSMGDYSFRCLDTPGHARGHMCLYEPDKKILMAGDHILIDITPNIPLWSDNDNPLDEYLHSLDKVYALDVELVLPGHRSLINDCKKRIKELKLHHKNRAAEAFNIVGQGEQNAFQVASQMTWDLDYSDWKLFPPSQKWFAFGEAVAHLKYLEEQGKIQKNKPKGKLATYSQKK